MVVVMPVDSSVAFAIDLIKTALATLAVEHLYRWHRRMRRHKFHKTYRHKRV